MYNDEDDEIYTTCVVTRGMARKREMEADHT